MENFFAHFHIEPLQVSVPETISHMPFIRAEHVQNLATGTSLGWREQGYVALLFVNLCCGVDLCCLSFFTPSFIGRRDRILVSIIYSLIDGCRLLFVCRRPPRIVDRFTVSVFTPDSSQWASVHTYLHIS